MVVLTAYATVLPDHLELALRECRTVREPSLKEAGCERYDFYQSPDDATKIVFVEEWTSRAHLEAHFEQPHFKAFFGALSPLLAEPPQIKIFEASQQS